MNRLQAAPANRVFNQLYGELDDMLSTFFAHAPLAATRTGVHTAGNFPPVNVWEDGEGYHLEAELPGLKLENLELTVKENELVIQGERTAPAAEGVAFHRRERGVGRFQRTVRFADELDADKVGATFTNGVLTLVLPKAAKATARRIEVKVG